MQGTAPFVMWIILFFIAAIFGPFILIFGLNLLGFDLAYNFQTWSGALLVSLALKSPSRPTE